MSWNAWRCAIVLGRLPLTAISGLPASCAVAMPVSEFVWPGPAGNQRERRLAMDPRPRVGGMRDAGLVPQVDDPEAGARRLGEDFVQMVADEREDRVEAQLFACPHECGGPVWHRNAMLLHSNQWLNERSS